MEIISKERFDLKGNVKEEMIQDYIFKHPEVLGLGKLVPVEREVSQNNGGRLDILMQDEDGEIRYEIEIQLGETDPSHIIRTIEYWDKERRRSPKYKHIAILIAENITNRYFNVISLFNKDIQIIAMQMTSFKENDNTLNIQFNTILDSSSYDDEEDVERIKADRKYWEGRTTKSSLDLVDKIFEDLFKDKNCVEKNYNKYYIGLLVNGSGKASIRFEPYRKWIYFKFTDKVNENTEKYFEDNGIEIKYDNVWKQYSLRINKYEDYEKIKDKLAEKVNELLDE